jgi:AcrR family transcriptional regulator
VRQSRANEQNVEDQPRLSRQLILDTAIGLVQREGESALSMRRIAQELDVWPMSLYRYFHDKQALLEALAEAAAEQIELPQIAADWQTQLRQLLAHARTAFATHPGGLHLRLAGPELPPSAARVAESGIEILTAAGLQPAEAKAAWQALVDYLAGSATSDTEQFEYGLDLNLSALRSRAGAPSPAPLAGVPAHR